MNDIQQYKLRKIEDTILNLKKETAQNIINIGKYLNDAKKLVQHGEWGDWLENKVGFSARSANQYMRMAKEYGSNSQAIADLGNTKLQILLDVPRDKRESFIEEHDVENMSTRELKDKIREHNKRESKPVHENVEKDLNKTERINRISEPIKRIDAIDNLTEENRRKIEELQKENKKLMSERSAVFRKIDNKCPVKYRWIKNNTSSMLWGIDIYIDYDGRENILYHDDSLFPHYEYPDEIYLRNVPEKYKNDFRMVWNQAYKEREEEEKIEEEKQRKAWEQFENFNKQSQMLFLQESLKPYWKKIFNAALKIYHVDNNVKPPEVVNKFSEEELRAYNDRIEECNGMTMMINQLKESYGV